MSSLLSDLGASARLSALICSPILAFFPSLRAAFFASQGQSSALGWQFPKGCPNPLASGQHGHPCHANPRDARDDMSLHRTREVGSSTLLKAHVRMQRPQSQWCCRMGSPQCPGHKMQHTNDWDLASCETL